MKASFLFLGTGSSLGSPVITCDCPTCISKDPYDKRFRSSALIKTQDANFVIDVGPDFRQQALRSQIQTLKGLILTHAHYDHIAGLDELRVYHFKGQEILPCLLSKDTFNVLHQESPYFFNRETSRITTLIEPHLLKDSTGDTVFQHKDISYVSYLHGKQSVTGYRFGSLCYITDISAYTTQLLHFIQGSEILVISLTRPQASQLHIGLEEVTKISQKTNIQKTFLTHISHNILHQSFEKNLPLNIYLAYDGLELAFSW